MPKPARKAFSPDSIEDYKRVIEEFIDVGPDVVAKAIRRHDSKFRSRDEMYAFEVRIWDSLMLAWAEKDDPNVKKALLNSPLLSEEAFALIEPE